MSSEITSKKLPAAIEALLFVSDEPVDVMTLSTMLECEVSQVMDALHELQSNFIENSRGIVLSEVAGGWRLYTSPEFSSLIEKYVLSWDTRKLSAAALETLAVIAYAQPVTRAGVASVRGVNSDSTISSLIEKGLVREAGVADAPGNPMRYATTRTFLEKFGLASTADLPPLEDFAPDEETRALIAERLSSTSSSIAPISIDAMQSIGVSPEVDETVSGALADALNSLNAEGVENIDLSEIEFDFDEE
jgi:segregation and condensation protein B